MTKPTNQQSRALRKMSRRLFTQSVGAGLLLSPFVNLNVGSHAAAEKRAKRLLLFCTMGTQPEIWAPTRVTAENNFTFSASTEPLAAIKQHIVMVDGLPTANPADNHGSPAGLSGLGYRYLSDPRLISVDQFVADRMRDAGVNRPISTLLLGAGTTLSGGLTMFNRTDNLATIESPASAFETVFGNATPGISPTELLRRRKSILDIVKNEVAELNQAVGSEERVKLQLHLDSLRQLENRLSQPDAVGGAGRCMATPDPALMMPDARRTYLQSNLLHMDIIVNAFACDITRVAAIEFGSDQSMPIDMPDLGLQGDQHGQFIHDGAPDFKQLIALERWMAQRFVELVNKLKATPEADGSGSLFDNTLVAWCRDTGDANLHNQKSMRFLLAGGAGGYLKTDPNGRYLLASGSEGARRHERVLLNICEGMGVTNFSGFGDSTLDAANKTPFPGVAAT